MENPPIPILLGSGSTREVAYWAALAAVVLLEAFAVAFTPDGKQVIAGGADKTVVVIDASTGQLVRTLQRFPDPIGYLSVSTPAPAPATEKSN
jgi:WD40 repeat protein